MVKCKNNSTKGGNINGKADLLKNGRCDRLRYIEKSVYSKAEIEKG